MRYQERHRRRPPARFVDEMQVDAIKGNGELREGVELGLLSAPVEVTPPIVDQPGQVGQAGAGGPRFHRRFIRPPDPRQPFLQVDEDRVGNVHTEGTRCCGWHLPGVSGDQEARSR